MPDKVFWCLLWACCEEHTTFSFHQEEEYVMVFGAGWAVPASGCEAVGDTVTELAG